MDLTASRTKDRRKEKSAAVLKEILLGGGGSIMQQRPETVKLRPKNRALLASAAAGAEFNRHSLHGLQDLWHQMYAEPYEQVPFQMPAPPPPPMHQPCPHHLHHPQQQCGGGGNGPFPAPTYFSHFDGYIYVRNPKEPERSGSGGRGRERSRRLPKRPPPNHQPFMPQPMSMEAAGCFRPSVPYYVADTLPGGEPVAAAGNYRGSEEEEECASSGSDYSTAKREEDGCCPCDCHARAEEAASDDEGDDSAAAAGARIVEAGARDGAGGRSSHSSNHRQSREIGDRAKSIAAVGKSHSGQLLPSSSSVTAGGPGFAEEGEDSGGECQGRGDHKGHYRRCGSAAFSDGGQRSESRLECDCHYGDRDCEGSDYGAGAARAGRPRLSRCATMVYSSAANNHGWGGVSGVPGLGVSIPAPARPGSSSAGDVGSSDYSSHVAWDNAGKSRLQLFAAKARRHLSGKSSSPTPSSRNSDPVGGATRSTSSDSGWNPQSLSNLKKLEPIPRVIPASSAERKASCASGSSSCSSTYHYQHHHSQLSRSVPQQQHEQQQARHTSLTHSSSVQQKQQQQQQQQHKALVRQSKSVAASSASPPTTMTTAQVHWSDDSGGSRADIGRPPPPRRSAQHRQSCHWNLRCPAAAPHHQRLQRLHHMAKSEGALVGAQPSSLPPNVLLSTRGGGFIPRAPIPTPPRGHRRQQPTRKSPSPTYEVLPGDGGPCDHHHHVTSSSCDRHRHRPGHNSRGHYSADNTFDSMEIPMAVAGRGRPSADDEDDLHYKVLHDREGHYSYAYDTSLSPAFLIRYNDERPPSGEEDADSDSDSVGSSKAENIYEEIADGVRSRIGSGDDGGGGGGRSGSGGSGTSLNSDSGVGNGSNNGSGGSGSGGGVVGGGGADRVNRRKFSSETLDFGPKSTHGRKISRFSNNSNGSRQSGDSATCCPSGASDDDQDNLAAHAHHRSLVTRDTLWLKTGSKTTVSTDCCAPAAPAHTRAHTGNPNRVHTMSDEAFSDAIRSHHSRVLGQLRLDQDECSHVAHSPSPTSAQSTHGDRDSGIQDMSAAGKKSSLSKVRAMRLIGGLGGRSKSQKSILNNNNNVMKRCESLDLNSALNEVQQHHHHHQQHHQQQQQPSSGLKGHWRRYSEAFRRRMSSTSDLKSEAAAAAAVASLDADEDPVPADESFNTLEPARRLRRSTITSRWENMTLDDDDVRKRTVECDA